MPAILYVVPSSTVPSGTINIDSSVVSLRNFTRRVLGSHCLPYSLIDSVLTRDGLAKVEHRAKAVNSAGAITGFFGVAPQQPLPFALSPVATPPKFRRKF